MQFRSLSFGHCKYIYNLHMILLKKPRVPLKRLKHQRQAFEFMIIKIYILSHFITFYRLVKAYVHRLITRYLVYYWIQS